MNSKLEEMTESALETGDLDELRGAVEGLRHSEERLRLMIEAVRDYAIFMLDPSGRVVSWNAGAERLKGYTAAEIIGQHFSVFYPAAARDRGDPEKELVRAKADGRYEEEGWRVRKDGSRFWANVVLTAVLDRRGNHIGFAKVMRDFTARRASEEELRQSEERFRLLVQNVYDYGIFMLDPEGHITSWNEGAQRIKGYSADEIIGKHFSIFYSEEDRLREHPQEELRLAVANGSYSEEGWRFRKDGTRFWASVVITALTDERGTHRGFAKVTRDMTERRMAEERLRGLNRELEAFSYSVSHDLRAPLRALEGFSRLLIDHTAEKLSGQELDYLNRIRTAAMRMSELTDAMLMLGRMSRTPMLRRSANISALSEAMIAELRQSEPERQVEVVIAPGLIAMADVRLLRVVIENLLRNAWKFTRNVGQARIEVGASEQHGEQVYFVKDNGAGFDPALAHKLFLPFQRLHQTKDFEGTGVGLATVHRIVQRHEGRIWATAARGEGATFYFTLGKDDRPDAAPEDGPAAGGEVKP